MKLKSWITGVQIIGGCKSDWKLIYFFCIVQSNLLLKIFFEKLNPFLFDDC